jgi:hypothetical protein
VTGPTSAQSPQDALAGLIQAIQSRTESGSTDQTSMTSIEIGRAHV